MKGKSDKQSSAAAEKALEEDKDHFDRMTGIMEGTVNSENDVAMLVQEANERNMDINELIQEKRDISAGKIPKSKFESEEEYAAYARMATDGTLDEIAEQATTDAKVQYNYYKTVHDGALAYEQLRNPAKFEVYTSSEATAKIEESAETQEAIKKAAEELATNDCENIEGVVEDTVDSYFSDASFPDINFGDVGNVGLDTDTLKSQFADWYNGFDMSAIGIDAQDAANAYVGNFTDFFNAGSYSSGEEALTAFNSGFTDASGNFDFSSLTNMFANYGDVNSTFSAVGVSSALSLDTGFKSKTEQILDTINELQKSAVAQMEGYYNDWYKTGVYLVEGLEAGVTADKPRIRLEDGIDDVVFNLVHKAETGLKVNSPSKVFFKIGEFITLGLANGISSLSKDADNATEDVCKGTIATLKQIIKDIYSKTFEEMDVNPVITPVLDLSELEAGLGTMDSMFNARNSLYMANGARGAFNAGLANKYTNDIQNGYDDTNVVNAITELRTDIDDLKMIVGTLGFYVDGKQMATAIANPMHKALNDISVQTGRGVR